MKYISKQYDFGFEWNYKMEKYPKYLNRYQKINKKLENIKSKIISAKQKFKSSDISFEQLHNYVLDS